MFNFDFDTAGVGFIALGIVLMIGGRFLKGIVRGHVDKKIEGKEEEANEAAKNSAAKLSMYRELKRKYDELRKR